MALVNRVRILNWLECILGQFQPGVNYNPNYEVDAEVSNVSTIVGDFTSGSAVWECPSSVCTLDGRTITVTSGSSAFGIGVGSRVNGGSSRGGVAFTASSALTTELGLTTKQIWIAASSNVTQTAGVYSNSSINITAVNTHKSSTANFAANASTPSINIAKINISNSFPLDQASSFNNVPDGLYRMFEYFYIGRSNVANVKYLVATKNEMEAALLDMANNGVSGFSDLESRLSLPSTTKTWNYGLIDGFIALSNYSGVNMTSPVPGYNGPSPITISGVGA